MFYKHLIIEDEKEASLFLFMDFNDEFSREFNFKNKDEKIKNIYAKVVKYIKDKKLNFHHGRVFLVVGSIVIGTLLISNLEYNNLKKPAANYQYVEIIDLLGQNNITNEESKDDETITSPNSAITEQATVQQNESVETKKNTAITNNKNNPPKQNQPPENNNNSSPTANETMVTVYRSSGIVEQIALETYVVGVVAAEMPASFNIEALKAQSVLARTYALKKISNNQILTDTTSTQVYKDTNQLKSLWGSSYETYYNKIKNATIATKDQYLTYNGNYIEALYHSTSNGQTENSLAVWGNYYPYLISVDSHWDLQASSYLRETPKDFNVISSILGIPFDEGTSIEILSRTSGNRIERIKIGDNIYTGIQLRNLLGLRSADFDIVVTNGIASLVTRGYGHGVGMSQYGANGMANEGYTYRQILSHYYPGTTLK